MTNNYDTDSRLRAIAMNAVREAMLVYQRWDRPFTDDDSARMDNIFKLLHLDGRLNEFEHAPLVVEGQSPVGPTVLSIADLLDKEPLQSNSFDEVAPVKVTLPKKPAA